MRKSFRLVGLTGLHGAGKDTVADILVAHCGFTKISFAQPLYSEVAEAFELDLSALIDRATKEIPTAALALQRCVSKPFINAITSDHFLRKAAMDTAEPRSPRQILQWWGTEFRRRHFGVWYWTDIARRRMTYMLRERLAQRFVISDCRFENEVAMVRNDFGGVLWQIVGQAPVDAGQHASAVDGSAFKPDLILNNSHTIRHLQQLVLAEVWAADAGLKKVRVEIED
ncbi:MAG: hypothetical protein J0H69_19650 [Burkholderiales bacterium]|nr:hypothetical protein [Burkholderiales bacterium]